jgi:hypothetical protein
VVVVLELTVNNPFVAVTCKDFTAVSVAARLNKFKLQVSPAWEELLTTNFSITATPAIITSVFMFFAFRVDDEF